MHSGQHLLSQPSVALPAPEQRKYLLANALGLTMSGAVLKFEHQARRAERGSSPGSRSWRTTRRSNPPPTRWATTISAGCGRNSGSLTSADDEVDPSRTRRRAIIVGRAGIPWRVQAR